MGCTANCGSESSRPKLLGVQHRHLCSKWDGSSRCSTVQDMMLSTELLQLQCPSMLLLMCVGDTVERRLCGADGPLLLLSCQRTHDRELHLRRCRTWLWNP